MRPRTHVFVGPSAPDKALLRGFCKHPPVTRHDLTGLVDTGPSLVVIIDGEFGQSLAVTATEIRALLRAGTRVWGAASMGALRAAECWSLGMRGWGWIYGRYRSGAARRDEDVALTFDPQSHRALTIPMVNVDWLCRLAVARGALNHGEGAAIRELAESIPWRERDQAALEQAATARPERDALRKLTEFTAALPPSVRNRKRRDAELVLTATRRAVGAGNDTGIDL